MIIFRHNHRCRHDPSSEDESEKSEKNEGDPEVRNNSFVVCADKNTMVLGELHFETEDRKQS